MKQVRKYTDHHLLEEVVVVGEKRNMDGGYSKYPLSEDGPKTTLIPEFSTIVEVFIPTPNIVDKNI